MNNALAYGLVELAVGVLKCGLSGLLVTLSNGLAGCAHSALELGADSLVALFSLAVGSNPLHLRLDIRHFLLS